jgi:hypothetical protein
VTYVRTCGAWFIRRRFALAAAVTAALALEVFVGGLAHADSGGWIEQGVPAGAGNILAVASVGPGIVWATGFTMSDAGGGISYAPLVLSHHAGSQGPWTPVQMAVACRPGRQGARRRGFGR